MKPSSRTKHFLVINGFLVVLISLIVAVPAFADLQGNNITATMFTTGNTGGQIDGDTINAIVLMTAQSGGSIRGGQYTANVGLFANNASTVPICGNGIVESGESCDSGGSNGACPATCSALCTTNSCTSGGSPGGGGGGGGGGAGGTAISFTPTNHTVSKTGSFDFVIPGMAGTHHVTIKSINTDTVTLLVQSTPVEVKLQRGESANVDLNGDKIADITLLLNSFTTSTVNFAISIIQKIVPTNVTQNITAANATPGSATQTIPTATNETSQAPVPAPTTLTNETPQKNTAATVAPSSNSPISIVWIIIIAAVTAIGVFWWLWRRKERKRLLEGPLIIPDFLREGIEPSKKTEDIVEEMVQEPAYPPAKNIVAEHTEVHHHTEHHEHHAEHHHTTHHPTHPHHETHHKK